MPSKTHTELRNCANRAMLRKRGLCLSSKVRSLRATHSERPIGTLRFTSWQVARVRDNESMQRAGWRKNSDTF